MKMTKMIEVIGVALGAWLIILPVHATTVPVDASDDAYVRYSGGSGTEGMLMMQEHVSGNNYAKDYLKFDTSSLSGKAATDAALSLVYAQRNVEGLAKVGVYGILDSADLDGWDQTTVTTATAPANEASNDFTAAAVYLGYFIINTSNGVAAVGDVFNFSSEALVDFLNTDSDGLVTIALNFEVLDGVQNFSVWWASTENVTYDAPKLEMDLVPAVINTKTTYQDSYVQYNDPAGNFGANTTMMLQDHVAGNYRKSYMKFDLASTGVAMDAALSFVVDSDNITGGASTFANIGVYGVKDSAGLDGWAEVSITKVNAPANDLGVNGFTTNATFLGNIAVNNANNGGSVLTLSSQALIDFVNDDTDGKVTFALNLNIESGVNAYVVYLASRENVTYDASSLRIISDVSTTPVGDIVLEMVDSGGNFSVSWDSEAFVSYALEGTDDLVDGGWTNVQAGIDGTGGNISVTNSVVEPQSFYRVYKEQ